MGGRERIKPSLTGLTLPFLLPCFPHVDANWATGCRAQRVWRVPFTPMARQALNSVPQGWARRKEVKRGIRKIQDILVLETRSVPKAPRGDASPPCSYRASMRLDMQQCN